MSTSSILSGRLYRCGGTAKLAPINSPCTLPIALGDTLKPAMPFGDGLAAFHPSRVKPVARTAALFTLALFSIATTSAASATTPLVWPPPPNPARIRFLQSVTGPADFGIRRSFFGRAFGFITGQSQRVVLARPFGVALDDADNLLVADTGARAVFWFDLVHKKYQRWDKLGPYRLDSPVAVAGHKATFYVADSALPGVLAFNVKGELQYAVTNGLDRPAGLLVNGEKLFVADAGLHCIMVFDLHGNLLTRFGQRGTAPGEFNFPTHLAADAKGNLLVSDAMNARIQILDPTGRPLGAVGSVGDGSGHFSRPKGVAADSFGHIYVADAMLDNLQIFDPAGQLLLRFGATGQQPGEFWLPGGIAINRSNRIYVADAYNRRVQIFQYVNPP